MGPRGQTGAFAYLAFLTRTDHRRGDPDFRVTVNSAGLFHRVGCCGSESCLSPHFDCHVGLALYLLVLDEPVVRENSSTRPVWDRPGRIHSVKAHLGYFYFSRRGLLPKLFPYLTPCHYTAVGAYYFSPLSLGAVKQWFEQMHFTSPLR